MKEIVIKLSDVMYERLIESKGFSPYAFMSFAEAVKNGTELPKGHGRLIDADAFIEFLKHKEYGMIDYSDCVIDDITEDAPTIIEADKEEE